MKINKKIVEELVEYLKEFNLSEIENAEGTTKVKVSRAMSNSNIVSTEINKKKIIIEDNGTNVTSPIVGTAYLAPEPGAKKFIEVGQKIKKGPFLETSDLMNPIGCNSEQLKDIMKFCGYSYIILNTRKHNHHSYITQMFHYPCKTSPKDY